MVSAKQVPAEVAALDDYLRGASYHQFLGAFLKRMIYTRTHPDTPLEKSALRILNANDDEGVAIGEAWATAQRYQLRISQLFHVTAPMLAVSMAAAKTLPGTSQWDREAMPSSNGVLMFEENIIVADVWNRPMTVRMVTWHRRQEEDGVATIFTLYSDAADERDAYSKIVNASGEHVLEHMGRTVVGHVESMSDGARIGPWSTYDDPRYQESVATYRATHRSDPDRPNMFSYQSAADDDFALDDPEMLLFSNVFKVIYGIFALMDQTVCVLSEEVDKRIARRARTKKTTPPMVTVIRLRREEQWGERQEGTGTYLTYRAVTRGHWRNQPYGPGRSEVRRIWINPYIRGPEDAPFRTVTRVNTLAR